MAASRVSRIVEIGARLSEGAIHPDLDGEDIVRQVMTQRRIVVLKGVFSQDQAIGLRRAVRDWGRATPLADVDDFRGAYHRRRAMVSRLQQAPHVFHDYNFNGLAGLEAPLTAQLRDVFDPLRDLYNRLTGQATGFAIPETGPYLHPQLIHYPSGGGFFGRHWHSLAPQQLGFIVSLSRRGLDYPNGATCFEIDGERVDMEGRQEIGDICVWRYDLPHWVTQSDLGDKFDWDSEAGRWVATLAYFDPHAPAPGA